MTYAAVSACGRGCLPRAGSVPRAGHLTRTARLLALLFTLLAGIAVVLVLPVLTAGGRTHVTRGWFRALLRAAGVRVVVRDGFASSAGHRRGAGEGAARAIGTLVAANHVSWLDIPAVLAVRPMRVIGKSDVRGWPVVGYLAARAGTIFIDRRRLRTLPGTVSDVAAALRGGSDVLVFPEGTTRCGRTQGPFYPAMFQAAVDAGAPVWPVALTYRLADGTPTTGAAFVGDDTLVASVWRVVAIRGLVVEVAPGPATDASGEERRAVADLTAVIVRGRDALVTVQAVNAEGVTV